MLDTLYKVDSKNKIRQWSVHTEGNVVVVTHGVQGGKQTEKRTISKGKNLGKVNETTPEQQALLDAQSKWNHQKNREDYHEDVNKSGLQLRPMLALDYLKVPHRVNWENAVAQPKLDGLRLTVGSRFTKCPDSGHYVGYQNSDILEMMTRKGETYNVPHLIPPSVALLEEVNRNCGSRCIALDGEAYCHGMPLQQITSRAKKYKPGISDELEFHVFDLVIPGMTFSERHNVLRMSYRALRDQDSIKVVDYESIEDESHLYLIHGKYTTMGYEGVMIRHANSEYGIGQRSPDLFKYKHFYDDEFQIVDVWEDNNGNAMLTCEIKEGQQLTCDDHISTKRSTFGCTPKRTHDDRKRMLEDAESLIGQWITVKYQALTDDKKPQFPVGLDLRECDENGNPIV